MTLPHPNVITPLKVGSFQRSSSPGVIITPQCYHTPVAITPCIGGVLRAQFITRVTLSHPIIITPPMFITPPVGGVLHMHFTTRVTQDTTPPTQYHTRAIILSSPKMLSHGYIILGKLRQVLPRAYVPRNIALLSVHITRFCLPLWYNGPTAACFLLALK